MVGVWHRGKWPVGVGAAKNDGVAAIVSQTPGALGYVERSRAEHGPPTAGQEHERQVRQGVHRGRSRRRRQSRKQIPADYRVSITNAPGDTVYPVSSFTRMLLYQDPGQGAEQGDGRVHEVGADGRAKFAADMGCAVPKERGRDGKRSARHDQVSSVKRPVSTTRVPRRDGFVQRYPHRAGGRDRLGAVYDASLAIWSSASILADRDLGSVSGSSARALHLGHSVFSVLALIIAGPIASASPSSLSVPSWLQRLLVFLTSTRHSLHRVWPLGHLRASPHSYASRAGTPGGCAPSFVQGRRSASACCRPPSCRHHDHSLASVARSPAAMPKRSARGVCARRTRWKRSHGPLLARTGIVGSIMLASAGRWANDGGRY